MSLRAGTRVAARARLAAWAGDPPAGERLGDGLRLGRLAADDLAEPSRAAEIGRALAAGYPTLDPSAPAFPYYDVP